MGLNEAVCWPSFCSDSVRAVHPGIGCGGANPIWRSRASICSASAEAHERAVQTGRPISCVEAGPGKRFWEPSRGFPGPIFFMFFSFTGFLFFLFSSVFVFYLFYFFFPFLLCFSFLFSFYVLRNVRNSKFCSWFQNLSTIVKKVFIKKSQFFSVYYKNVQCIYKNCSTYITKMFNFYFNIVQLISQKCSMCS